MIFFCSFGECLFLLVLKYTCHSLRKFIGIYSWTHFLEPLTSKTPPKYFKSLDFYRTFKNMNIMALLVLTRMYNIRAQGPRPQGPMGPQGPRVPKAQGCPRPRGPKGSRVPKAQGPRGPTCGLPRSMALRFHAVYVSLSNLMLYGFVTIVL